MKWREELLRKVALQYCAPDSKLKSRVGSMPMYLVLRSMSIDDAAMLLAYPVQHEIMCYYERFKVSLSCEIGQYIYYQLAHTYSLDEELSDVQVITRPAPAVFIYKGDTLLLSAVTDSEEAQAEAARRKHWGWLITDCHGGKNFIWDKEARDA
jgi:hypothetical protein